ncbi:MAG: (2Fe-2S)-binding protein, partial [Longimicrobiales bacterium]
HDVFDGAGPDELAPVCRAEGVTAAEIRYAVEVEGCRTLEDLRRHAHIGAGPCDGADCTAPAAHLIAELLDWPPDRTRAEIAAFLDARWAGRRPVLMGATLAAEEVMRGL